MEYIKEKISKITDNEKHKLKLLKIYFEYFEQDNFWPRFGPVFITVIVALISFVGKSTIVGQKIDWFLLQNHFYIFTECIFVLYLVSVFSMYIYYVCMKMMKSINNQMK